MIGVTLPRNVNLDVDWKSGARDDLADIYTDPGDHVICWSQGPTTLGHETMVASCIQVEKGREPLDLAEIEEESSGDSRRPSWRARSSTTTS